MSLPVSQVIVAKHVVQQGLTEPDVADIVRCLVFPNLERKRMCVCVCVKEKTRERDLSCYLNTPTLVELKLVWIVHRIVSVKWILCPGVSSHIHSSTIIHRMGLSILSMSLRVCQLVRVDRWRGVVCCNKMSPSEYLIKNFGSVT